MKKIRLIKFSDIYDSNYRITNYNPVEKDKSFSDDGIFSERIFGDFSDDRIDDIGWVDLEGNYIINPIMYNYISRLLGKKLERMIRFDKKISREGEIISENEEDEEDDNIGLDEFRNRFVELIKKWGNKNKYNKEYDFVLSNHEYVFIDKIPVFNSKLRPASLISNIVTMDEINNEYNLVLRYKQEMDGIENKYLSLPLLFNIQILTNKIWNMIINDYLKGKKGWLRKNILGARIDYCARFVIGPQINKRIDEVTIPYVGFAELYKYQLISLIAKSKKINYIRAERIWRKKSLKFDEELYSYMQVLLKNTKGGCRILLNRNPTIAVGSILFLRIGSIKKDYSDLTLNISNNVLDVLGGDYDGDTLNVIPIFDMQMKKSLEVLSPQNLLIDKNNGRFNRRFSLLKEQICGIYILNN